MGATTAESGDTQSGGPGRRRRTSVRLTARALTPGPAEPDIQRRGTAAPALQGDQGW